MMTDNPFDIRVLDPQAVRLFRAHPGDALVRLTLGGERSWREVRVARAFPFSAPDRLIGLRDGADKDIGIVEEPRLLDEESRVILEEELARRYFTPRVQRVLEVKEEMGTVTWEVETDRGGRRFVIRNLRDSTFPLGPNRLMMTDVNGNRYEFPDITAVGGKAYQVLTKVL